MMIDAAACCRLMSAVGECSFTFLNVNRCILLPNEIRGGVSCLFLIGSIDIFAAELIIQTGILQFCRVLHQRPRNLALPLNEEITSMSTMPQVN